MSRVGNAHPIRFGGNIELIDPLNFFQLCATELAELSIGIVEG